ncbi:hypothetical protein ACFONN_17395 [Dyella humi]
MSFRTVRYWSANYSVIDTGYGIPADHLAHLGLHQARLDIRSTPG